MASPAQFEQVVAALMSADNAIRKQAEAYFNESKKQPDFAVASLIEVVKSSKNEEVRSMGGILLRRLISKGVESLWTSLQPQTQETVKAGLIQVLEAEKTANVRTKIADCISYLGENTLEKGQWNDLLPFMFKCTKSPDEGLRESALHIFCYLATCIGDKFRPYFNILKEVLHSGLSDTSIKVRVEALSATANFLQVLQEPQERSQFQQLTPLMLDTISQCLNTNNEEEARSALEVFVDLAELDPVFLRPNLNLIINAMLTISTHPNLEDGTKNLAVEFLITLAENKPTMARKFPKFVESVVPIVLNMMLQIEEDEDWNNPENEDDDDDIEIENNDIGEENLDRLSLALGGKAVIPVLFTILPQFLKNPDWKYRHTALLAISIAGEGSLKYLMPNLPEIIKIILPFFSDPHPRVRWAACNTVGQMATDFGPDFQNMFHSQVLPALISVMDDAQNPRVQSHAASAVINFCEHATADLLAPYLEALLGKLYTLLQGGKTIVQEQTITAIAAIADCARESFTKFYDLFMPFLKQILANALGKDYRMLRGKAMECVSIIGVAVGKAKFIQDAREVMELLMKTQSMQLEADDPQIGFLLQSWARVCKCLGQDFVPFLPHVMPSLIASAKLGADVTINEKSDDADDSEEGWDYVPVGDKRIGIHTSSLEEKATACNMLYCYASDLKEGFFPYVQEVANLLVPLMKFYYHDGVRSAAVATMPHLLISASLYFQKSEAAKGADAMFVRNLFNFMLPNFLDSIHDEVDLEQLVASIGAFIESLETLGENSLTPEQVDKIVKVVLQLIEDVDERRKEANARKTEEDHDEEEEERIEDEAERDAEIMSGLGEIIGHLARYNKAIFLPIFNEKFIPVVAEMIKPTSLVSDRQTALCIFDDIIEYCGADAFPYYQQFIAAAIVYSVDPDPAVRQAALFGLGLVAQNGGDQIAPAIPDILARLTNAINLPDSKEGAYAVPTENAVAAVGKIILYQGKVINQEQVLNLWFSWLPVTKDNVESKVTYKQLCTFIESNNPYILGQNMKNLPKILTIFADILDTKLIDEEITKRIGEILKRLQTTVPGQLLGECWSVLSAAQQQKLQKAASQ